MTRAEEKSVLEEAYKDFHKTALTKKDAIHYVNSYPDPRDQEIVAFISATLAYGNVKTILTSIERALAPLTPSPYEALGNRTFAKSLKSFQHRWTSQEDLHVLYHWLAEAIEKHGSLESLFSKRHQPNSMKDNLSHFISALTSLPLPRRESRVLGERARNLKYLLPDPSRGSACKRMNMFLRWMVRKDDIDFGLWNSISPSELMIPLDTHLMKVVQDLGWTTAKSANWRVVEETTMKLRTYDPVDPIRFDFSLCHLSMEGERIRRVR